jgi:hypothetical protein
MSETMTVEVLPNKTTATEPKVIAATAGGGIGYWAAELVLWLIDTQWLTPDVTGDLPAPVTGIVPVVVGAVVALVLGWWAKHQWRRAEVVTPKKVG